ncbi:Ig-like domain-containing protein [Oscillospiraceae bacterium CM]|nr:Ig-like domain-containing protein [Oscillospiraceae bacterium CM]
MAVISDVKCTRCDRRYSGFRSRCPYCGARRNKRGKNADTDDNARAKLVIGVILLVVLLAASMVLIFSSLPDSTDNTASTPSVMPSFNSNEDVTSITPSPSDSASPDTSATPDSSTSPGVSPSTSPSGSTSPSSGSNVAISKVEITWLGNVRTDVTMEKVGDTLLFGFKTTPVTTGKTATWESSDDDVIMVQPNGRVTATGKGSATLKVTVDGKTATCVIHVRAAA